MNVNKIEVIGIFISIVAMALALWFLRVDDVSKVVSTIPPASESAVVFVATDRGQNAGIANAVVDATVDGVLSKVIVNDVTEGEGASVAIGDTVSVHYIGTFQDGRQFDNSYERGTPFSFSVGAGKVISGWEQGIVGMKIGGKRIIVVPPEFAYGEKGFGPIPPNTTLVFALELISIK